jgi:hypothetical protein
MDTPRISSASARHISVDWSLIAITVFAVALLVGTTVRTGPEHVPGTPLRSGGLEVLGPHETLVAFEDFSFGAQGWTAPRTASVRAGARLRPVRRRHRRQELRAADGHRPRAHRRSTCTCPRRVTGSRSA